MTRSINFVTAHDGFTLADLVAYAGKHNEANGEHNSDGTNENHSWNNGVEGPSDDPVIQARRDSDIRALLATLLLSRGTPMLSMGDEAGRTQSGNNNAYAQDNRDRLVRLGHSRQRADRLPGTPDRRAAAPARRCSAARR